MATTRELLEAGIARLREGALEAGLETPRLDAELLLAHAVGVDRTAVIAHPDAPVGPEAEAAYRRAIERRVVGEPVAYLRGIKEFHGLAFAVDPRALIPRPETELLVDLAFADVMDRLTGAARPRDHRPVSVLDVGTGSGAVAIALAVALRKRGVPADDVAITAVDIVPEALDLARENAVGHAVGDRVRFVGADLLPPVVAGPWDVIAANLPYVRSDALARLPAPTTYEPAIALDGGADGLVVIDRLLAALPTALAHGGLALLEIGSDQGTSILEHVHDRLPGWRCRVEPDLAGLPRVARIERAA
ncbi:MAG: peptide chain release factor N(5)-glutamine methyltransferase [Chloroflexota bacterium]|nr:peptide chain release factor N(5)-glutamine methyltransferase [Chloroflexota bacterium]